MNKSFRRQQSIERLDAVDLDSFRHCFFTTTSLEALNICIVKSQNQFLEMGDSLVWTTLDALLVSA